MSKTIENLVGKLKEKDEIIDNLSDRVNHLEQYGRNCNIEIADVQVVKIERLEEVVLCLADKMGIRLANVDIEAVHRLPAKNGKTPGVIVQFASRRKRNEFISKKAMCKVTNRELLGNGNVLKVFINENITPYFKSLLWHSKSVARKKGYKYVRFKFGKVLIRKDESSAVVRITTASDLDKLV